MTTDPKTIGESVQNLTDSILKLSTALLIVPVVFLTFIAEIGSLSNQEALRGVYPVENPLKSAIFVSFGVSILLGLLAKYQIMHKLNADALGSGKNLPNSILIPTWGAGFFFLIGLISLICLFFQFSIEIPEPFRLGRSHLG